MKRSTSLLAALCMALCMLSFDLYAQLTTPRPSPAAELTQTIGLTKVTVNYSRPQVIRGANDRTGQIWGNQVPYGLTANNFGNQKPMPWRAGANENTVITFSTPVKIEGKAIAAGSYGLHMIPNADGTVQVLFSTNTTSWGSFWYEEAEEVLRVSVKMEDAPFTNVLTYDFVAFSPNTGTLALSWDDKRIPIQISVDQETTLANIRDQLRGVIGFGWQGPLAAASYCLNNNINHEEAIGWADRAIAANRSGQTLGVKAALLFQVGNNEEGVKVADEAKEIANVNELNILGYQLMGAKQMDKAKEFFLLNIERNPEVANCYDSMGECYVAMGDEKAAIKMFKKSLAMNPPANVKANSIANLQRLGVEQAE
ncbi:DUF2911 domain-containing protein [Marinoscillum furvescens]|uniref:Tetratricopeptide repeat protein n=1 Tax=Marinoscillum furvescens DSM 4134 TaxID=1122208 RepID=A0A3D9LJ45_MARFU|nr:DUF2911 domain-containing protein [Marinoscillum furvescens]REE05895.1 tetratricopeptide repeat protein [Marinoscillum furvescens DSM 4134]